MRAFERDAGGHLTTRLEPEEATLLAGLASQIIGLLTRATSVDPAGVPADDPALRRLLPDAYPDDADASAEFRRFTVEGLTERKVSNAVAVIASLSEAVEATVATDVHLDASAVQAWLRCLTDMRLALAERLGLTAGDANGPAANRPPNATAAMLSDVYDWLGFVQESLLQAMAD